MKTLDPGHKYQLKTFDGEAIETLSFVKRVGTKYPGNEFSQSGTISQEVLKALIDRAKYVNSQKACWQNEIVIWLLTCSLYLLEMRHSHKHKLGFLPSLKLATSNKTCNLCGHTKCDCN